MRLALAGADAIGNEIAVLLRREVRFRIAEPLKDLQSLITGESLVQIGVEHGRAMAGS